MQMEIKHVDPKRLAVSDMNERREGADMPTKLATSIDEAGLFQLPAVRETGASRIEYEVVVGQRRVQASIDAGLDEIPVLVFPWDDGEAMYASIAENIKSFRRDAGERNRAKAVVRLMHLKEWNVSKTAEKLEVPETTVNKWCERGREFWKGTPVHVGGDQYIDAGRVYSDVGNEEEETQNVTRDGIGNISDNTVAEVRREVEGNDGDSDEAVDVLDTVVENDLTRSDVSEARDRVDADTDETDDDTEESSDVTVESDSADRDDDEGTSNGGCDDADDGDEVPDAIDREANDDDSDDSDDSDDTTTFTEAIEEVAEENSEEKEDTINHKKSVRFTVVDDDAMALENATASEGLTVKQLGRKAIAEYLEQGEYYE